VPELDEESTNCSALVVPVQGADRGAHLQELPAWKIQKNILWAEARKEVGEEGWAFHSGQFLKMCFRLCVLYGCHQH